MLAPDRGATPRGGTFLRPAADPGGAAHHRDQRRALPRPRAGGGARREGRAELGALGPGRAGQSSPPAGPPPAAAAWRREGSGSRRPPWPQPRGARTRARPEPRPPVRCRCRAHCSTPSPPRVARGQCRKAASSWALRSPRGRAQSEGLPLCPPRVGGCGSGGRLAPGRGTVEEDAWVSGSILRQGRAGRAGKEGHPGAAWAAGSPLGGKRSRARAGCHGLGWESRGHGERQRRGLSRAGCRWWRWGGICHRGCGLVGPGVRVWGRGGVPLAPAASRGHRGPC